MYVNVRVENTMAEQTVHIYTLTAVMDDLGGLLHQCLVALAGFPFLDLVAHF